MICGRLSDYQRCVSVGGKQTKFEINQNRYFLYIKCSNV